MKPKPLASLNHLTFPDVLIVNLLSVLPSEIKRSSSSRAGKSLLYRSQRAGTKANSAPPSFERRLPAGFPVDERAVRLRAVLVPWLSRRRRAFQPMGRQASGPALRRRHVENEFECAAVRAQAQQSASGDAAGHQVGAVLDLVDVMDIDRGVELRILVSDTAAVKRQGDRNVVHAINELRRRRKRRRGRHAQHTGPGGIAQPEANEPPQQHDGGDDSTAGEHEIDHEAASRSGSTMLAHGSARTAMIFASSSSCVADAPSSRCTNDISVETSAFGSSRAAALRMFDSVTATLAFAFAFTFATWIT